jgi:ADP-glucose type glycogen/starch synthase
MNKLAKLRTARRPHRKPRILICTPEITELPEGFGNAANYIHAKGGGLGDVSAGLVRHLLSDGRFQLHVALPKYDAKIRDFAKIGFRELDVLAPLLDRRGIHLVSDSSFSNIEDVYAETSARGRVHRAIAFQRHITNYLLDTIRPDLVHCNDWMTGLIPAAARAKGIRSLFTLHNVFTEKETAENIDYGGIDIRRFSDHVYFESYPAANPWNWTQNPIDFLATGIHAADVVNTVSKTFLQEVLEGEFAEIVPASVRHTVQAKHEQGRALGIMNAPRDFVDPRVGRHIIPYDVEDLAEKKPLNKKMFQEKMGLHPHPNVPLFFWPSRLYSQKGPELLCEISLSCVDNKRMQIAVVANGDPQIEGMLCSLAEARPGWISHRPFNEELGELGRAGSDFLLMPSRYEPCGLPQMECPRFGTLPVARLTGGIRDTVAELDTEAGTGNGFTFLEFSSTALALTIDKAIAFYHLPESTRIRHLQRIMEQSFDRFSLANTAAEYIGAYEELIGPVAVSQPAQSHL